MYPSRGPGQFYPRRVHLAPLNEAEQRVLGCLLEKRFTTPDQYPLSLNALRLACNQSTNRDPVTDYDEATVREAAQRLNRYGLARLASGHASRAIKYRHLGEERLGLASPELATLAVLLLRGPQTPGELKARTERMERIGSLEEVERILGTLMERGHARRLEKRPGQKEERYEHLLGGSEPPAADDLVSRVEALEVDVAFLRSRLAELADPGSVSSPAAVLGPSNTRTAP